MSKEIWLIADTHFGHRGVCEFTGRSGQKLRPWDNAFEMDEALVERWNSVVKPNDRVYHLGDLSISRKGIATIGRCNGKKVLIKGNHDIYPLKDYLPFFEDIRGSHELDKFILTHIPIHPESVARWCSGNVHGHLHDGKVLLPNGTIDKRYICVSVEQINYCPINFEDIKYYYE